MSIRKTEPQETHTGAKNIAAHGKRQAGLLNLRQAASSVYAVLAYSRDICTDTRPETYDDDVLCFSRLVSSHICLLNAASMTLDAPLDNRREEQT